MALIPLADRVDCQAKTLSQAASVMGTKGGKRTLELHGPEHFSAASKSRKVFGGGWPKGRPRKPKGGKKNEESKMALYRTWWCLIEELAVQMEAAHRTALAKGEVGIRETKCRADQRKADSCLIAVRVPPGPTATLPNNVGEYESF